MPNQKKRAARKDAPYLVATFANLPGVEIPLLSKDACEARGIEPGRLPPIETWSPEQQKAGRQLGVLLYEMAAAQALQVLAAAVDQMPSSDCTDIVAFERHAAQKAIDMMVQREWTPPRGPSYTYGLEDWMQHFLRSIAAGEFSLIDRHADRPST